MNQILLIPTTTRNSVVHGNADHFIDRRSAASDQPQHGVYSEDTFAETRFRNEPSDRRVKQPVKAGSFQTERSDLDDGANTALGMVLVFVCAVTTLLFWVAVVNIKLRG